jgi:rRNA maturation endonuclease Nob1
MSSNLLKEVKRFLTPSSSELFECRNCGKTLEEEAEECPECGGEDIASYKIE